MVDIRASAVLKDIPELQKATETNIDEEQLGTAVLASEKAAQQIGIE